MTAPMSTPDTKDLVARLERAAAASEFDPTEPRRSELKEARKALTDALESQAAELATLRASAASVQADQRGELARLAAELARVRAAGAAPEVEKAVLAFADFLHRLPSENGYEVGCMRVKYDQYGKLARGPLWVRSKDTERWARMFLATTTEQPAPPSAAAAPELGDRFMEILRAIHGDMPDAFADSARLAFVHALKERAAAAQPVAWLLVEYGRPVGVHLGPPPKDRTPRDEVTAAQYIPLAPAASIREQTAEPAPIDMILYCPNCGLQHVDAPDHVDDRLDCDKANDKVGSRWTNPPHRSHLCHGCGTVWRPADVPTNGVADIKTRGKADTWPVNAEEIGAQPAQQTADARDAARYRWLRDSSPRGWELLVDGLICWKHDYDAAIDAAAGKREAS